jgi:hypothetical protein
MKKIILLVLVLFSLVVVFLVLTKHIWSPRGVSDSAKTDSAPKVNQLADTKEVALLNVLEAHSLNEWRLVVPKLNHDASDIWAMVQEHTNTGVLFQVNTTQFYADAVKIVVNETNLETVRIELQSPIMNIASARVLGDSLLETMGKDKSEFHAWCDKAGNKWSFTPLFSSIDKQLPNGKFYGFTTLHGFNNDKPWIVNLIISDP